MNFFKSVFSEDPDPSDLKTHEDDDDSSSESPEQEQNVVIPDQSDSPIESHSDSPIGNSTWSFGGLMKTLTTKSESVIQTYKRDLEEFSTGLKNETVAIREVASRAVKEIPVSIEAGASVAQGSLESVWRGTSEIISQGKDVLLSADFDNSSSSLDTNNNNSNVRSSRTYSSRFEANVYAIQNDINSYSDELIDMEEYKKWKLGFDLEGKGVEIENLLEENNVMEGIYEKLVPSVIDSETFWSRYFYRVYKLQQVEDARANLVKRAISVDDEEDLSWDVDDDEEEESENKSESKEVEALVAKKEDLETKEIQKDVVENKNVEELQVEKNSGVVDSKNENKLPVVEVESDGKSGMESTEKVNFEGTNESAKTSDRQDDNISGMESDDKVVVEGTNESAKTSDRQDDNISGVKSDDKVVVEGTNESAKPSDREDDSKSGMTSDDKVIVEGTNESAKIRDRSGVSGQAVVSEEEDLGWDEIEDVGSDNEKKATTSGSPNRDELRKRLSTAATADEDEDLSWDIDEDEDEPVKH